LAIIGKKQMFIELYIVRSYEVTYNFPVFNEMEHLHHYYVLNANPIIVIEE